MLRVLGPGDHGARRHHGRDVAVDEAGAGQVGERHHGADGLAARRRCRRLGTLASTMLDLVVVRQVVQRGDDVPAVHLALVDLLRAVIEAGGVAEADRVRGREQAEGRVRPDHRFWSSRVSLPSTSSTRWITNITSGRPASYSSNTSAPGAAAPRAGCLRGTR